MIATEQYPKGLGKLIPELVLPTNAEVFEKTRFSMLTASVTNSLRSKDIKTVVLFGIEVGVVLGAVYLLGYIEL